MKSLQVPESVKSPRADVLQAVVSQVQRRDIPIMDELVGVEPREKVAVEEKLGYFIRGCLKQTDRRKAFIFTVDV